MSLLRRALADEPVQGVLTERLRRDGSRVQVSLTMAPIRDEDGRAIGVSTTARDVTESLRADAERTRLAAIVRSTSDAVVAMDLEGRVTDFNTAAAEMFGFTADSIGTSVLDAVGADESQRARRAAIVRRAGSGRDARPTRPRDSTARAGGSSSRTRSARSRTTRARSPASRRSRATSPSSARRRSSSAGSRRSSTPRATRSSASGSTGRSSPEKPAAARTFGWTDEEAIGRPGRGHVRQGGTAAPAHRAHARDRRGRRVRGRGESAGAAATARTFAATVTGFPVRDAHGSVHAAAFIVRDVTEQRRLEDCAKALAWRRSAGSPAASRTTSTTCSPSSGAILELVPGPAGSTGLEAIERAARRAADLTGQLLGFSRRRAPNPRSSTRRRRCRSCRCWAAHRRPSRSRHAPRTRLVASSPTRAGAAGDDEPGATPATRCPTAAR